MIATTAPLSFGRPALRPQRDTGLSALLSRGWSSGALRRPSLDPDRLIARAIEQTRLDDFGSDHWCPRLDTLCAALEDEAALTPLGRTIAHGQLVATLRARLTAQALWARHPEILDTPLTAPIVVLGQMRSGTTRVQRLLACDPALTYTRFHESCRPVLPRRPHVDLRPLRAALELAALRLLNPGFAAIHPTAPTAADEEVGLLGIALAAPQFEVQWRVPRFARALENADMRPAYAEFRALLQTLRWLRGETDDRPWVLKVPQFMQDLPALLDAFPDARLLCVERGPVATVGSAASLVRNQMSMQSDTVDPHWIGREWLHKIAHRQRVATQTLAAHSAPRLTLTYAAMDADWRGAMRGVYRWLGRDLEPATLARMAAFANRRRGAAHRYDLAAFGLTPAAVARARALV